MLFTLAANVLFIVLCTALSVVLRVAAALVWLLMLVISSTITVGYYILRFPLIYRDVRALRKELATQ